MKLNVPNLLRFLKTCFSHIIVMEDVIADVLEYLTEIDKDTLNSTLSINLYKLKRKNC